VKSGKNTRTSVSSVPEKDKQGLHTNSDPLTKTTPIKLLLIDTCN